MELTFNTVVYLLAALLIFYLFQQAMFNLVDRYWPKSGKFGHSQNAFLIVCPKCGPEKEEKRTPTLVNIIFKRGGYCKICGTPYVPICPKCGSAHHQKRTLNQYLWGGWSCCGCGSTWNKYGNKINENT